MEEGFDLDLTLDESAMARIAHADFLTSIKDWGVKMGLICAPFAFIAHRMVNDDFDQESFNDAMSNFPTGVALLVEHLNEFYDAVQDEAVKILGAPFVIHDEHSPECKGTKESCGHQDHWIKDAE